MPIQQMFLGAGGVSESDPWYVTAGRQYENFSTSSQVKLDSSRNVYATIGTSNKQTVFKFKNDGTLLWQRSVSQCEGYKTRVCLDIDSSGNVYIAVKTNYQYSSSTWGAHLVKLDSSGGFLWSRVLDSKCTPADIVVDPSGNIYMVGTRTSQGQVSNGLYATNLSSDIFCAKWNSSGTLLWQRKEVGRWDPNYLQRTIMSQYHKGYGITYVGAYSYGGNNHPEGVVIAGRFSKWTSQSSTTDFLLTRLDTSGNREWVRSYGITQYGTVDADEPDDSGVTQQCLVSDSSGDLYCTGIYGGWNTYRSVVFKIRGDGSSVWQRRYGNSWDKGVALAVDSVNNSKVVADGFLTVKKPVVEEVLLTSVIPLTLAILTICPSVKLCPPEQVTTGGFACVIPVIVASPNDVKLSTTPVAAEVPPVNVSPVVNAPEAEPFTFK